MVSGRMVYSPIYVEVRTCHGMPSVSPITIARYMEKLVGIGFEITDIKEHIYFYMQQQQSRQGCDESFGTEQS